MGAEFSVAAEWLNTDYRETGGSGRTLNREGGNLPGLLVHSRWQLARQFRAGLFVSRHQGEVDYSGQTQTGRALTTRTRTRLQELGGWLGYQVMAEPLALTLLPGIRFSQWDRDIEATSTTTSLETRYRWWTPEIALQFEWSPAPGYGLSLRPGIFRATGASAQVDPDVIGAGRVTTEPEGDYGPRLLLSWSMPASDALDLSIYAYFEKAAFQASDAVSVSTGSGRFSVREPESSRWRRGLGVGLTF